jgi:hypothetical protein
MAEKNLADARSRKAQFAQGGDGRRHLVPAQD